MLTTSGRLTDEDDLGFEDYVHRGIPVRQLRIPHAPDGEQVRYRFDNPLVAGHLAEWLDELRPDFAGIFHMGRLSSSIIPVLLGAAIPTVFIASDYWSLCQFGSLRTSSGETCDGPDGRGINCLRCSGVHEWPELEELGAGLEPDSRLDVIAASAHAALNQVHEPPPAPLRRAASIVERTTVLRDRINAVGGIVASTEEALSLLRANGIDRPPMRHSPWGVLDRDGVEAARSAREPSETLRIGFVGSVNERKGVDVLLRAFRSLDPDLDVSLRLVGPVDAAIRPAISEAESDPRVIVRGRIEHEFVARELTEMDVLILPSLWRENGPLVMIDALASGIPVIASDMPGIRETIEHGINGLLFPRGDSVSLAGHLLRLARDRPLLAELSEGCRYERTPDDFADVFVQLAGEIDAPDPGMARNPIPWLPSMDQPDPSSDRTKSSSSTSSTNGGDPDRDSGSDNLETLAHALDRNTELQRQRERELEIARARCSDLEAKLGEALRSTALANREMGQLKDQAQEMEAAMLGQSREIEAQHQQLQRQHQEVLRHQRLLRQVRQSGLLPIAIKIWALRTHPRAYLSGLVGNVKRRLLRR